MRDDREVTVVETGGSGLRWFLAGAVLGAGLGLLFAPQSGQRTRRDIAKRARQLRDDAEEKLDDLTDDLKDRGRRVKDSVEELVEDVEDGVRDGRKKLERTASNARDELERRLADARTRRRAAVASDTAPDDE